MLEDAQRAHVHQVAEERDDGPRGGFPREASPWGGAAQEGNHLGGARSDGVPHASAVGHAPVDQRDHVPPRHVVEELLPHGAARRHRASPHLPAGSEDVRAPGLVHRPDGRLQGDDLRRVGEQRRDAEEGRGRAGDAGDRQAPSVRKVARFVPERRRVGFLLLVRVIELQMVARARGAKRPLGNVLHPLAKPDAERGWDHARRGAAPAGPVRRQAPASARDCRGEHVVEEAAQAHWQHFARRPARADAFATLRNHAHGAEPLLALGPRIHVGARGQLLADVHRPQDPVDEGVPMVPAVQKLPQLVQLADAPEELAPPSVSALMAGVRRPTGRHGLRRAQLLAPQAPAAIVGVEGALVLAPRKAAGVYVATLGGGGAVDEEIGALGDGLPLHAQRPFAILQAQVLRVRRALVLAILA
mmetsp:Transcript_44310/g.134300  ORF Transcript_44310/g.134300 Transcript_44310/m.134300 type:complete len:416 (-) Transcript_44310:308-1555(-)